MKYLFPFCLSTMQNVKYVWVYKTLHYSYILNNLQLTLQFFLYEHAGFRQLESVVWSLGRL